jgi:AcrR family transcriptional regulator
VVRSPTATPPRSGQDARRPGRRIRGLDAAQRLDQRRSQLLDAALELFASNGYHNTSIEQLCQAAYVGNKGFYEIFDSKEACYLALLRQITDEVSTMLAGALLAAPAEERRGTATLISAFAHSLVDDPRVAKVTFGEASGISPAIERQRRANRRWAAEFVESVWQRYGAADRAARNSRRRIDRQKVAIGVIGGMFDLVADWLIDARPGAPGETDRLIADLTAFYQAVRNGLHSR